MLIPDPLALALSLSRRRPIGGSPRAGGARTLRAESRDLPILHRLWVFEYRVAGNSLHYSNHFSWNYFRHAITFSLPQILFGRIN